MNLILTFVLGVILLFDLWLALTKRKTISAWYQEQFPSWYDMVPMLLIILLLSHVNIHNALRVVLAVITGHLFWPNIERYRK